jgi:hypothetical protein
MVKNTKPAAKPRKTARPRDDEEPDPTPKRTRTAPKSPVTIQEEENNLGQSPVPETIEKLYQALPEDLKILPKIPKKNSTGTTTTSTTSSTTSKLDPDLSFKDILEEDVDVPGTSGSKSGKEAVCGDENAVDLSQSSEEDDDDHDGRLSAGRAKSDDKDGQKLPGQDSQHSLAGAQAMEEDSSSPTSTRRASAPVSSSKDDKEFNQLVLRLQGSAGWRSIFQGKDPFSGAFEDTDPGAAARK